MGIELKPCPFCGRPAISFSEGDGCVGETCENSWRAYAGCNNEDCAIGVELYESGDYWCGDSENDDDPAPLLREECDRRWNMRTAVGDPDFSRAIHDGIAWQKVRECHLPKTKVDHGIIEHYGTTAWRLCDECGEEILASPANFCPNCGAKVVDK